MTGMLIGAVFGTIFVIVNAHSPLNAAIGTLLRVVAVLGLAGVIGMWVLAVRRAKIGGVEPAAIPGPSTNMFSPGYWAVVAAEVVLLFGGIAVLRALDQPEQANVAWVAFVVGIHFVALAPVWKQPGILVPGVVLTLYGVAGLIMASTSAVEWVPLVSGVLSGATLLAGSIFFARLGLVSQNMSERITPGR
ncbi:hypothetical protein [Actinomadura sp. HBU206391]|uniref:hypothetical protein n=1 Tax=Actinomadura sp. HBU206391 TaxID=2731692 RepID=UPI001C9C98E2|nr:hypothetical protein [Actinomadura sp. HBU206391]